MYYQINIDEFLSETLKFLEEEIQFSLPSILRVQRVDLIISGAPHHISHTEQELSNNLLRSPRGQKMQNKIRNTPSLLSGGKKSPGIVPNKSPGGEGNLFLKSPGGFGTPDNKSPGESTRFPFYGNNYNDNNNVDHFKAARNYNNGSSKNNYNDNIDDNYFINNSSNSIKNNTYSSNNITDHKNDNRNRNDNGGNSNINHNNNHDNNSNDRNNKNGNYYKNYISDGNDNNNNNSNNRNKNNDSNDNINDNNNKNNYNCYNNRNNDDTNDNNNNNNNNNRNGNYSINDFSDLENGHFRRLLTVPTTGVTYSQYGTSYPSIKYFLQLTIGMNKLNSETNDTGKTDLNSAEFHRNLVQDQQRESHHLRSVKKQQNPIDRVDVEEGILDQILESLAKVLDQFSECQLASERLSSDKKFRLSFTLQCISLGYVLIK